MIGSKILHYEIISKLGEGGMGVVYLAQDTELKRKVAIKFLPSNIKSRDEDRERFRTEAQAAAALNHANIATIHAIEKAPGESGEELFIVMEYVSGSELREVLDEHPHGLSIDLAVDYVVQIASALKAAHKNGIIHRDIKSANVMVTEEKQIKVMDFGLAKIHGGTDMTKAGTTLGTTAYMSPEQARGQEVTHQTDIWAVGVLLYEMITGRRPFTGDYEQAITYAVINEEFVPVDQVRPGVSPELAEIVAKTLSKSVDVRYQDATEFINDLDAITGGSSRSVMATQMSGATESVMESEQTQVAPESRPERATETVPTAEVSQKSQPEKSIRPGRRLTPKWLLLALIPILALGYFMFFASSITDQARPTPDRKRIVVLPLENLGQPEDEYFADGITQEIISRLSSVSELGVIPRTSAMQYKNTTKNIAEIGEELDVDYALVGTVIWDRSGGGSSRVRVTPELIQIGGGTNLWSDRYDRVLEDVFSVQSEIAEQVIAQLGISLLEKKPDGLREKPTQNMAAYQDYLKGKAIADLRPSFALQLEAIAWFTQAIAKDPDFLLAHAELSIVHAHAYHQGYDRSEERLALSKEAVDRAFEIAPQSPHAYYALGYYHYWGQKQYDLAIEAFAIAERGLPNNERITEALAYINRRQGNYLSALERLRTVVEKSPRFANAVFEVGYTHQFLRQYADAITYYDKALEIGASRSNGFGLRKILAFWQQGDLAGAQGAIEAIPENSDVDKALMASYIYLHGMYEGNYSQALNRLQKESFDVVAIQEQYAPKELLLAWGYKVMGDDPVARPLFNTSRRILEEKLEEFPDDHRMHSALGLAHAGLGNKEIAIKSGKRGVDLYPLSHDAFYGTFRLIDLALIYTMVGEEELALDQLTQLLSIPSLITTELLRIDPRWAPLRDHPRYQQLLVEFALP